MQRTLMYLNNVFGILVFQILPNTGLANIADQCSICQKNQWGSCAEGTRIGMGMGRGVPLI